MSRWDHPRPLSILGFVNHIPPRPDVEESIEQALEWGVDYIVAQGTGSDWGPYWLGSGDALATDLTNNLRPYLRTAVEHEIPFLLSVGIAGADVHLERSLDQIDRLCAEEGWKLRLGVVATEIDTDRLAELAGGRPVLRAQDTDELPELLDAATARRLTTGRRARRARAARRAPRGRKPRRDRHRPGARHRAVHGARPCTTATRARLPVTSAS